MSDAPRPRRVQTQTTVRTAYDTVAADYARSMPDTSPEHALDLSVLDTFIAAVETQPILDAGCGAGRISRYIADRGGRVVGVDLSPQMIAQGRARHPDLDLSVASITDLPHGDATFGGVLLWYSTIHLSETDLGRALDEAVRVVAPGGYVLVAFQSGVGTRDLFRQYSQHGHDVTLERYLRTPDEMAEQLAARGMSEVVRLVRSGNEVDRDGQTMLLHHRSGPGATPRVAGLPKAELLALLDRQAPDLALADDNAWISEGSTDLGPLP